MNGYPIHGVFSDLASGIAFDDRREFFTLIAEILEYKVERVLIPFKARLSRGGFGFFTSLCPKYGPEIICISEVGNPHLDAEEVFEAIVSLLQCYSLNLSRTRRKTILEVGVGPNSHG